MKKLIKTLFDFKTLFMILLSGFVFNMLTYIGAGISSIIGILSCSLLYLFIQLWFISKYSDKEVLHFIIGCVISNIAFSKLFTLFPIFYSLFTLFNKEYGKPNAGSGFGVLLTTYINWSIFVFISFFAVAYWIFINKKSK